MPKIQALLEAEMMLAHEEVLKEKEPIIAALQHNQVAQSQDRILLIVVKL